VDAGRAEGIEKRSLKRGTNDGLVDCNGVPEAPRRDMLQRSARRAPRPGRFLRAMCGTGSRLFALPAGKPIREINGMANVVAARLVPWEPGLPGIAYELDDGSIGCIAGNFAFTVPGLKSKLNFIDRRQFEDQMRVGTSGRLNRSDRVSIKSMGA